MEDRVCQERIQKFISIPQRNLLYDRERFMVSLRKKRFLERSNKKRFHNEIPRTKSADSIYQAEEEIKSIRELLQEDFDRNSYKMREQIDNIKSNMKSYSALMTNQGDQQSLAELHFETSRAIHIVECLICDPKLLEGMKEQSSSIVQNMIEWILMLINLLEMTKEQISTLSEYLSKILWLIACLLEYVFRIPQEDQSKFKTFNITDIRSSNLLYKLGLILEVIWLEKEEDSSQNDKTSPFNTKQRAKFEILSEIVILSGNIISDNPQDVLEIIDTGILMTIYKCIALTEQDSNIIECYIWLLKLIVLTLTRDDINQETKAKILLRIEPQVETIHELLFYDDPKIRIDTCRCFEVIHECEFYRETLFEDILNDRCINRLYDLLTDIVERDWYADREKCDEVRSYLSILGLYTSFSKDLEEFTYKFQPIFGKLSSFTCEETCMYILMILSHILYECEDETCTDLALSFLEKNSAQIKGAALKVLSIILSCRGTKSFCELVIKFDIIERLKISLNPKEPCGNIAAALDILIMIYDRVEECIHEFGLNYSESENIDPNIQQDCQGYVQEINDCFNSAGVCDLLENLLDSPEEYIRDKSDELHNLLKDDETNTYDHFKVQDEVEDLCFY
ncbi:unnamed protein product [Moneuplotes crassus]|uniref:Uncharacterized protein n=1 Tax=Euplotes crassus TaxID=5936 RepID=A0AAD1U5G2_EUPCR|nr:unnamed protein product [Moneuplotes crassus]